jgi:hypothetical protein
MAVKSNLTVDQGTDFSVTIDVVTANSAPINLSGYTGNAQFRKHYSSLTYYPISVTVRQVDGTVTLAISKAISANVVPGRYVYDCILTSNTNISSRIVEGILTISPGVTR